MDPHNEMDLTAYLQTEGRRRAAELGSSRPTGNPGIAAPTPQTPPSLLQQQQQQCATPASEQPPPQSLSEALRRMGVA